MSTEPSPPTAREQALVRRATTVVERCALDVSRRFHGLVKPRELVAVGTFGLYRAARTYRDDMSNEFADYAFRRVRDAMLKAVRAELFQHRVRVAAIRGSDAHAAHFPEERWSSLEHDENDARRGLRKFFGDLLTATLAGALEQARRIEGETPGAVAEEYRQAIRALDEALSRVPEESARLLVLIYRDDATLEEAGEALDLRYETARRRHSAALATLRGELSVRGVTRAPPLPDEASTST